MVRNFLGDCFHAPLKARVLTADFQVILLNNLKYFCESFTGELQVHSGVSVAIDRLGHQLKKKFWDFFSRMHRCLIDVVSTWQVPHNLKD